jgi:hypothetical protein
MLVGGFEASCRMNADQQKLYTELNEEYKKVTGARVTHSICNKVSFLNKVKAVIDAENN